MLCSFLQNTYFVPGTFVNLFNSVREVKCLLYIEKETETQLAEIIRPK